MMLPREGAKYGNRFTYVDGIRFASKREAERYRELTLLLAAGEITNLELQVRYPLVVHRVGAELGRGAPLAGVVIGHYVADFTYADRDGIGHVEDAKGYRTALYKLKKRMVEAIYGILVEET